jgi:hypothetical protein
VLNLTQIDKDNKLIKKLYSDDEIKNSFLPMLMSANSFAYGISEDAKQAIIEGEYFRYIWLGADNHIK